MGEAGGGATIEAVGARAPRPGGRSARVQASVHRATRDLVARLGRGAVTIPLIAAEAGVTPSTIYRRWGDLQELLADIALGRLRPEAEPADTGAARTDLRLWAEQYAEEMASGPGREMIRDVLAAEGGAGLCCTFIRAQIEAIARRAAARGEPFPDPETIVDRVVAPIMYRILFDLAPGPERVAALVADLMADLMPTPPGARAA